MKERNRLIFSATLSIFGGGFGIIGMLFMYIMYGSKMCALTLEHHPDTYWFVIVFKLVSLGVCPTICFLLAGIGIKVLFYLKHHTHPVLSKNPNSLVK